MLGEQTEICVYGHYGPGLLLFPFDGEDYLSAEQHDLIAHVTPQLDAGRIKIYTINSIDRQSWLNDDIAPRQKSIRHGKYNRYILDEVVPFIAQNMKSEHPVIFTSGISLGALHAVNMFLRQPNVFEGAIGISGNYDLKVYTNGYHDNDVYYNSPADYLTHLTGPVLNKLRQKQQISFLSGRGEGEHPEASEAIGKLLSSRGIPNTVDLWSEEYGHNWDAWRTMFRIAIERNF